MTHLRIILNTTGIEEIQYSVLLKLYELASSDTLDQASDIQGRINATAAKLTVVDYLTTKYPNLYITANKWYMNFADPLVESICATNWGDGTGITLALVQAVGFIDGSVFSFKDIETFDEFLYFTSNRPSLNFCEGCTKLTSIRYPSNVTYIPAAAHERNTSLPSIDLRNTLVASINRGAFEQCSALASVYLPTTCTTLQALAFGSCSNLATIDLSHVTNIYQKAFLNCTSLQTVDLSSLNTLQSGYDTHDNNGYLFDGCTALQSVQNMSNLTYLNAYMFSNCTSLTTFDFTNIRKIQSGCFYNCTSLGQNQDLVLTLDNDDVGPNCFYNTAYRSVTLHAPNLVQVSSFAGYGLNPTFYNMPNLVKYDISDTAVEAIDDILAGSNFECYVCPITTNYMSWGCIPTNANFKYFIVLATTPPAIESLTYWNLPSSAYFYVPDESLEAYKAADKWSDSKIVNKIKPISELPASVTWATKS